MNAFSPMSIRHLDQAAVTQVPLFDTLSCAAEALMRFWSFDDVDKTTPNLLENLATRVEAPKAARKLCEKVALSPWQERRAKDMMASHMDRGLSIAQIASECSLSRSHFSRAFKKNTGFSPRDWFLQVRLDKAKGMLTETSVSISRISLDCGFADQSHFTRVFNRVVGQTPFSWRRSI